MTHFKPVECKVKQQDRYVVENPAIIATIVIEVSSQFHATQ